jgi:uncharacterized membrane protein
MHMSQLLAAAVAAAATLPVLADPPAPVPTYQSEKCYGIAAKAANDCGTAAHSCAGTATKAKDPSSWIYLPVGTCTKIVGGSVTAPKT